jgi:phospholipid/cholesterol/gamma-HCH transport system substrate-binding protein
MSRLLSSPRRRRLVVLPLGALVSAMLGGCALSLQSLPKVSGFTGATYPVRAVFANVLNLPDNAQVRIGAEVIGQVGTIATRNFQADLTLDIRRAVRLPVGTTAQVRFDDPLGDEYVMLQPPAVTVSAISGQTPYLAPGSLIPESNTSTAPSIEDTFGALSLVLNGGGINQLEVIIHELNDTFDGNQAPIRSLLGTINQGVSSLAGGQSSIDNALASISNLSQQLNGGKNTIANGINSLAPAIGVLASQDSQISSLITQLSNLGAVGTQIAEQSGQNSVQDARDLLPVVQQLVSVTGQLAPDLSDLDRFEAESPKVAPGDYLQVNAVVNVLLPSGSFEANPLDAMAVSEAQDEPSTGAQAVADLLSASLS